MSHIDWAKNLICFLMINFSCHLKVYEGCITSLVAGPEVIVLRQSQVPNEYNNIYKRICKAPRKACKLSSVNLIGP